MGPGATAKGFVMKRITRTRIAALALIGLVMLGLAYLKVGTAEEPVSVPKGALAGDLILDPCTYSTENGNYAADCGTLVVPENRADPDSRLIALPVTRIKARSDNPAEPIFRLQGGPGISNMEFARASRFADDRDVVLVGYRGVDSSVRLDCPEVVSALKHSTDVLAEKSFGAYGAAFRACADRLAEEGVDVAGYGLPQQVEDLEAARKALGYDRIDLVSESVGTRTAMIYAWEHPESIHRSVMIAVNPPGHFLWDGPTIDEQIARYAEYCSQDEFCSARTDDLTATMKQTAADMPERWFFLPVKDGNVRVASFFGLMETTSDAAEGPLSAPMTLGSWLAAADGDASGFWFQSLLADIAFPESFVWGQMAAATSLDAKVAAESFSSGSVKPETNLGDAATAFVWGGGRLADSWPAAPGEDQYTSVRDSDVETLLIGGELDFATPPQGATDELLPHLPNGKEVVLPGFGHSGTFWTEQPEAGTHLITTYLASGEVDDSLYEPQAVDFTPEVTQTALGKGIGGAMVGLALLTVVSLLWMAGRVRWLGGYGRKASAVLRSVYAVVLGLGGWFAGVLIVITTMPGTPLDNELLATVSIGVAVGLGIYLAWVRRDRPAHDNRIGLAAAAGGALLGAWLGFHVASGLLALLTAIAGAVAGANLLVILLDVSRARSTSDRLVQEAAEAAGAESAEPRTLIGPGLR
jgi:pimeloyl-ACP methyl ester carboxylesterase